MLEYINTNSFTSLITDMTQFSLLRQKIFAQPTIRQTQVTRSIASANTNTEQTDDSTVSKYGNVTDLQDRFFIHYTHEKRFRPFKRDMHQLYDNVFQQTPAMAIKIVVGNRNRRDGRKELIHKRPKQYLLSNKQTKTKRLKSTSTATTRTNY
jgi:hypothetical protein